MNKYTAIMQRDGEVLRVDLTATDENQADAKAQVIAADQEASLIRVIEIKPSILSGCPAKGTIVIGLPKSFKDGLIELDKTQERARLTAYIGDGNPLDVVAIGEGVSFADVDDQILIRGGCSLQEVKLPEGVFFIIRELDCLYRM